MQLSTFPIALAALLLAGRTTAAGCKAGTKYCGHTLYNMGKFTPCPFLHPETILSHKLIRAADRLDLSQYLFWCARGLASTEGRVWHYGGAVRVSIRRQTEIRLDLLQGLCGCWCWQERLLQLRGLVSRKGEDGLGTEDGGKRGVSLVYRCMPSAASPWSRISMSAERTS